MFKRILIPTDGSGLSQIAVQQGVKLAKESGAKVTFLNVAVPFHVFTYDAESIEDTKPQYEKRVRARGERILGECQKVARGADVPSDTRFYISEHPYEEIVKAARDADLVVMASHGRKGVKGVLLGSETQKTLTHSDTPVLVIR
ncbi:MAG TPA: universal stress protein [Burkholderiales bacterium]|nr:universal stress protein [Burkholderiales bacterium]